MNEKPDEAGDTGVEPPDERPGESLPPSAETVAAPTVDAADEAVDEAAERSTREPPPAARRTAVFAAVAALAFVIALAALAGVGYLFWQGRDIGSEQATTDATLASLADNFDETLGSLDELRKHLATLTESDAAYGSQIDSLERQLDQLLEQYENIPARLTSLETALTSLQGISTGARDSWWLAEAEYYMQIANAQLQLAGNPRLARLALQFADERLRSLGNPALTDVRRALARELRALEVMETPDIEGTTMRLGTLAETVGGLPIEENVTRPAGSQAPPVADAGPFDRAMASLKRAFGDMVSVRRSDEEVRPLLSPEARYFLRANLALQMQTARLALLRGEAAVFDRTLADAERWLREYYDSDADAVQSTLAAIAAIRESYVSVEPPDITRSLRLLRQYRARNEAERPADNRTNDGPDNSADDREGVGARNEADAEAQ